VEDGARWIIPGMQLRRLRLERNLSQGRLARLAGIARLTVHRVEHGRQKPHRSTVIKLARVLEVRPEEIAPELFAESRDSPPGIELTQKTLDETMPYIKKAARRLALNTADVEELVGAGREGLWEACRKYDASRGVPFDRYARWLSICRVKDEARRLYRQHPGYGLEAQGIEPWTY
jgi:transcriptional regulator with XRE-family HTH domain